MKSTMKHLLNAIFALLVCANIGLAGGEAMFGLTWGMSPEQVKASGVVLEEKFRQHNFSVFRTERLPKNLNDAKFYVLIFDESLGLCKVVMTGTTIKNDPYGMSGKQRFEELEKILTEKYHQQPMSSKTIGIKLWDDPDEFYQCLAYDGCGLWGSVFLTDTKYIGLKLEGIERGMGYIEITVEAEAEWKQALEKKEKLQTRSEKGAL